MLTSIIGVLSALVSGLLNGSFATPMKKMDKWKWENIWLIWALWALIIVPLIVGLATVTDLLKVYQETDTVVLIKTFLFGVGWGLGAITFGAGLYMVGLSLGFTIIMGVTSVAGSLIPMLINSPGTILTTGGLVIVLGMFLTLAGVAFCGRAGAIKEKDMAIEACCSSSHKKFKLGLIVCLVSGVFNAMLNLAFVFGAPIAATAKSFMLDGVLVEFRASNAIWVLALAGGFITNLIYCGACLLIKKTWRNYKQPQTSRYWFYAFLMGMLWMSGVVLYGAGASSLGKLGATVAWIIFMATTVFIGNFWGILSGEWKGASKKTVRLMLFGLMLLVVSIVLVSLGNYVS